MIALNDAFMAEIGVSTDDTNRIPDAIFRSDAAAAFTGRIYDLLEDEFPETSLFVLKDPRIARTAPAWIAALRAFGAQVNFILPFRAPGDVAHSLMMREKISYHHSLLLWLRYLLDAEYASRNFPRAFVDYEALTSNWRGEIDRIAQRINLSRPTFNVTAEAEVDDFIRPARSSVEISLSADDSLLGWADEIFEIYKKAATADIIDSERLDEIAAEFQRAEAIHSPRLLKLTAALEAERVNAARLTAADVDLRTELYRLSAEHERDQGELARLAAVNANILAEFEQLRIAHDAKPAQAAQLAETKAELERKRIEYAEAEARLIADHNARIAQERLALEEADADIHVLERRLSDQATEAAEALALVKADLERRNSIERGLHETIAGLESALHAQAAAHLKALESMLHDHQIALSSAVNGERALGERLLEVLADTTRIEMRAETAEREKQALRDELTRAQHAHRVREARARIDVIQRAEALARERVGHMEVADRLRAAEDELSVQAARTDLILQSRSWALTRPLRVFSRLSRKLLVGQS